MTARAGRGSKRRLAALAVALAASAAVAPSRAQVAETLVQTISREDPLLDCGRSSLTVGRDGMVYLTSARHNKGFVLRISPDGKRKFGREAVYAIANATANSDGVVASANGHFAHKVTFYDAALAQTAEATDFRVGDNVGWDAPCHVEAGEGGDFYGLDLHRDRIVRLGPKGKVVTVYKLPHEPAGGPGTAESFRVHEGREAFWVRFRSGAIRCVGFDGKVRWQRSAGLAGQWYLHGSAYDVDGDGVLHLIENRSDAVKRFDADGEPLEPVKLDIEGRRPPQGRVGFFALAVCGGDLLVRSEHDTELFQRYDRKTGAFRQSVSIDSERLTVTFPSLVWTAGERIPFDIRFDSPGRVIEPAWRVWARPYESADYRELEAAGGRLEVPADLEGLVAIKVTPETQPYQRGPGAEYVVRAFVEVRRPGSRGTLTVMTPQSRVHFGSGERVPFSLVARSSGDEDPVSAKVLLLRAADAVVEKRIEVTPGGAVALELPGELTRALLPGDYVLAARAEGFTCCAQRLTIGHGAREKPFWRVQYGDYGELYPSADAWVAPDVARAHAERKARLGFDLVVDRIGAHTQIGALEWANNASSKALIESLRKRLDADPSGVAPGKVLTASPLLQTMAAYGSSGIRQMAILMYMDAGLPLGTGHDNRKPENLREDIRRVTEAMRPYPAFRGWSWSSNWWVYNKRGSAAADGPAEKSAYEAALRRARETGGWDAVLDKVSDRRLAMAVDAQAMFNKELDAAAPGAGYVTAVAGPYRNVESYPPVTYSNVDEVDLHIQWEQVGVPYHCPHNVDFCKRPGKRGWGHPEVWNDSGTGDQVMPNLFMMLMRGADGVGCSGPVPPWADGRNGLPDDPRIAHYGTASVFRSLNEFLRRYGPWLATLETDDDVAIVASGRMFRIDDWKHVTGLHFARVMEAYVSCLAAHRPASIVFAEDVEADTFRRFKAVLVVDQRVELEPGLKKALLAAKRAGVGVHYDGTCRRELVGEFEPLGVSFDKIEHDPSPAGDDAAYWRFAACAEANVPALEKALSRVPPVAGVANSGVVLSRRRTGAGRCIFVVNNTMPDLEPGQLWRVTLGLTSRVPLRVPVRLDAGGSAVYELLAMKRVTSKGGAFDADLRAHPARIFVLLPEAVERVELRAPTSPTIGGPFKWQVNVRDAKGEPIDAGVPLRVRLTASDGSLVHEVFRAAGPEGAGGEFVVPVNSPAGAMTLEAAELLSGRSARLDVSPVAREAPFEIAVRGNR